jgi:hypothetical protein
LHSFATSSAQSNARRLFLDCVLITKPPPNKRYRRDKEGNAVAQALSYAFLQNQSDVPLAPTSTTATPTPTPSRSPTPRIFQHSTGPKFSRSGRVISNLPRPSFKPIPEPVLSQAEIDTYLETRIAPIILPCQKSGRQQAWEDRMVGESAVGTVGNNVRFLGGYLVIGRDEAALPKSDHSRPFGVREIGRMEGFLERLETCFGQGSIFRGSGPRPHKVSGMSAGFQTWRR